MGNAGSTGGKDAEQGRAQQGEPPRTAGALEPPGLRLRVGSVELVNASWIRALMDHLDHTESQLHADRTELAKTRAELQRLQERVADLDERFNDVYGMVNRLRADVSDERDAEHHDCAQRFRRLCQRLISVCGDVVASQAGGEQPDPALRPPREARVTRAAARQLFGPLPPEPYELLEAVDAVSRTLVAAPQADQLRGLCVDALALRADVARLGGPHRWDFEVDAGAKATGREEYQVWYSCVADAPIVFAVTPAYLVAGRAPYVPALVYTAVPRESP
jgi:hypothetical protein